MLEFKDIEHFAPFIQLLAGFNVAYILADSFNIIRKKFSGAYKKINITNKELENALKADLQSYDTMSISCMSNSQDIINNLKDSTVNLKNEWNTQKRKLIKDFKKQKYDFSNIFLFISLYNVFELLFIGSCCCSNKMWISHYSFFFNIIFTITAIIIFAVQSNKKTKFSLGKNVIVFAVCTLITGLITFINELVLSHGFHIETPNLINDLVIILCILIPIIPITLPFAIFEIQEHITEKRAKNIASAIYKKREENLKKKKTLENANRISQEAMSYN